MEFGISVHVSSFYVMFDSVMLVTHRHGCMSVFGVLDSLLLMPGVVCLQVPLFAVVVFLHSLS